MATPSNALPAIDTWFAAIHSNDTDLLEDLLAQGVPVDVPHPLRHSTALMEATRLGRTGMVQWLLEHGAAPAFLCGFPFGTALHCALRRHHWDIACLLAHAMNDCALPDAYGATPLHLLCTEAFMVPDPSIMMRLAAMLLKRGCPLDAPDHEGATALHHCVMNDMRPLATLLLDRGADPNARVPGSLVSPLAIAALDKNIGMARLLMLYGADPQMRTRDGATPVTIYPPLARLVGKKRMVATPPAMARIEPSNSVAS